jgi:Papain family cysteine protease
MDRAFTYGALKGVCSDASYPYTSAVSGLTGTCHDSTCSKVAGINSVTPYVWAWDSNENPSLLILKSAIAQQPVTIGVYASNAFMSYSSGVFTGSCSGTNGNDLNHVCSLYSINVNFQQNFLYLFLFIF